MAKISGFQSQDVEVVRKETPDSDEQTLKIPPSWLPLIEKIFRWYDNAIYPVFNPFFGHTTRSAKERNRAKTYLPDIQTAWAALPAATKANWKTAASFVKKNSWQLFVKDTSYRIKNTLAYPRAPDTNFPTHGLLMSNPLGLTNVRIQRDDINLTGQVTLAFNYKKTEHNPTAGTPFKAEITLWYFEAGENKTETHTWTAPAGNVAWASVSETYGTADRLYHHQRIIFYLDSYDADVYLANFLISDKTLSWTVDYDATTLPENATPAWVKTGTVSTEKIAGNRLFLNEAADSANSVKYSRTPTFTNAIGSSVKFRFKIDKGTEKDAGNDQFTCKVTHCDGIRKAEFLFYQNGIILKLGSEYFKYHYDMTRLKSFKSFIRADRLYFYIARSLAFRKELSTSGAQEVSFEHHGRDDYETQSDWGFVRYFQGIDEAPGEDVVREGWWILAGETWEPDNLYRKKGWTFTPEYHVPYFNVVYLG